MVVICTETCMTTIHSKRNVLSSFSFLYKWLPFLFSVIFVLYISTRMTTFSFCMDFRHVHFCTDDHLLILNGFSSCTFLYKWLPFLFERIVVMHISVRMTTISFWKDCRHARFCANDYHFFSNGFSSCMFLCEWLPFLLEWIFVIHVMCKWLSILCTWISSYTFLCEWLSIFYWFSMCAMLFNGWIARCSDEL